MKTIILASLVLSGCSSMNGWEHGGRLLEQGPVVYQMPQQPSSASDIRTGTTSYNLPSGSYLSNRVGNTVTIIQTSKTR